MLDFRGVLWQCSPRPTRDDVMQDQPVRRFSRSVPGANLDLFLDLFENGRALLSLRAPDDEVEPLSPASAQPSEVILELEVSSDPATRTFSLSPKERAKLESWASRHVETRLDPTWEQLRNDAARIWFGAT